MCEKPLKPEELQSMNATKYLRSQMEQGSPGMNRGNAPTSSHDLREDLGSRGSFLATAPRQPSR